MASQPILIAVMGPVGAGKSSFISRITGFDAGICQTLHSGTHAINEYTFSLGLGVNITLVDTPGFDDTFNSDFDVLHQMAEWLSSKYDKGQLLNGILYLQPITKNRIEGSTRRCMALFEKLCGQHNLRNVLLVTTFWNEIDKVVGVRREEELVTTEGLWKELKDRGARIERMGRDYNRYYRILQDFGNKPSITLQIQDEMKDGKSLVDTLAGLQLDAELQKMEADHEDTTRQMEEDFQRELAQREREKKERIEILRRRTAHLEEVQAKRRQREAEAQQTRLRQLEAEQEQKKKEREAELARLEKLAAEKEANLRKQIEAENRRKYLEILAQAKLKFRAGMLQQKQIDNQLDVLRMCAHAGMVHVKVDTISLYGRGTVNTDEHGNVVEYAGTGLTVYCDVCRQTAGSQSYMCCEQMPCPVTDTNNFLFAICSECWVSGPWRILEGKTCQFKLRRIEDTCKRAGHPNHIMCSRCHSKQVASGEIEGVFFHCHICDNDDFDLCLQCALEGHGCWNSDHKLIWGVQRVDLGKL